MEDGAQNERFSLNVNGKVHAIEADPDMPLLYALRNDIGLNNPRFGCGLAQCGACTVHLDRQPVRSCTIPLSAVGGGKIVTLEGLGTPEKPHPLQTAYVEEQVLQCGYCTNGWIMTAAAGQGQAEGPQGSQDRRPADQALRQRKFTVAHDCGQIINPDGLKYTIEGNVVQGISRTLLEEVKFDDKTVSVDWQTYPILDITETPDEVDIVLINHPEIAPSGAGEPSSRPMAAAIANAVFDATGVRLRRVPFTPDWVRAALS